MTEQSACYDSKLERASVALSHLDPSCDRETWVKYGMGLKQEFGDAGFDVWDAWSAQSEKYSASGTRSAWKSFKQSGKVTIASLIYDAKEAGFKDDATYKKPTREELANRQAAAAARAAQAALEEAEAHKKAAAWALALWEDAAPCESHPYLERKGVSPYGLRVGRWERIDDETGAVVVVANNALLLPIRDRQRYLWSLQGIFVDPKAKKLYLTGSTKAGHFHAIGKPKLYEGRPVFVLGEGYATCASVHAATEHLVLVCFDVSNLIHVARNIRERAPDAWIVFAADNDTQTEGNPGVTAARKAAAEVGGLVAVPPPGDFNDLQLSNGLEAVADVIATAIEENKLISQAGPLSATDVHDEHLHFVHTRDENRRYLQQKENQFIQEADGGAMVPNQLSVEEMIERCVWMAEGKYVAYVTGDRSLFLKFDDFRAVTASSKTEVAHVERVTKKQTLNAILWQADLRRVDAMTATFHPGKPIITPNPHGLRAVNTWRPINRWTTNFDIKPFLDHIEYLFQNSSEREVFLDWLAHLEQKPGELPHYGWLHVAENTGTGRNWLASVLARVFRGYVAPNVDLPALLESPFNGELAGRVLAIVDEVQEGASEGNYRHAERLKSMINAEMRTVNVKYGLKYTEYNVCRWLVFSNHQNALPLNEDDRRFRVVMHQANPRDPMVYERLYALLHNREFINAIGVFLRDRDIGKFKPGERPPLNTDKLAAIAASKPMSTQNAEGIVASWPADVILYEHAIELLTGDLDKKSFSAGMRRAMEEVGCVAWRSGDICRIKINGMPHRVWILRNHAKWLAAPTDEVRKEAKKVNVTENRTASSVLADAIEEATMFNEPPI